MGIDKYILLSYEDYVRLINGQTSQQRIEHKTYTHNPVTGLTEQPDEILQSSQNKHAAQTSQSVISESSHTGARGEGRGEGAGEQGIKSTRLTSGNGNLRKSLSDNKTNATSNKVRNWGSYWQSMHFPKS